MTSHVRADLPLARSAALRLGLGLGPWQVAWRPAAVSRATIARSAGATRATEQAGRTPTGCSTCLARVAASFLSFGLGPIACSQFRARECAALLAANAAPTVRRGLWIRAPVGRRRSLTSGRNAGTVTCLAGIAASFLSFGLRPMARSQFRARECAALLAANAAPTVRRVLWIRARVGRRRSLAGFGGGIATEIIVALFDVLVVRARAFLTDDAGPGALLVLAFVIAAFPDLILGIDVRLTLRFSGRNILAGLVVGARVLRTSHDTYEKSR